MSELIALFTRFVVAIETIAAHLSGGAPATDPAENGTKKTTRSRKQAEEPEDDEDTPEPEAKKKTTSRKSSTTSTRGKKTTQTEPEDSDDLEELRDEISQMATHIAKGDSDECADKLDELLEDYGVRNVNKLKDGDVEEFHKAIKKLTEKYYDVE